MTCHRFSCSGRGAVFGLDVASMRAIILLQFFIMVIISPRISESPIIMPPLALSPLPILRAFSVCGSASACWARAGVEASPGADAAPTNGVLRFEVIMFCLIWLGLLVFVLCKQVRLRSWG